MNSSIALFLFIIKEKVTEMSEMFKYKNKNKLGRIVGDCVVRAISTLLNQSWDETYIGIAIQGFISADMPSSDDVWGDYLIYKGYERCVLSHECPNCLTVREFAERYDKGRYLLFVGGHVVPVVEGTYYDTWDSGDKTVIYFFRKREKPD